MYIRASPAGLLAQVTQLLEELGKLQTKTSETARSLELVRASEAALLEKGALYRQAIRVLVRHTPPLPCCIMRSSHPFSCDWLVLCIHLPVECIKGSHQRSCPARGPVPAGVLVRCICSAELLKSDSCLLLVPTTTMIFARP